jgi:hypothetical protein
VVEKALRFLRMNGDFLAAAARAAIRRLGEIYVNNIE